MTRALLIGLAALPGTESVFNPGLLLWAFPRTPLAHSLHGAFSPGSAFGLVLLAVGVLLAEGTVRLFVRRGDGTPAPWAPTRSRVVLGPYRHVRNPMTSCVFLILAAGSLLLRSWPILAWLVAVAAINLVYIPRVEVPGLPRRLGESYREYCAHVPRWAPRLQPWHTVDTEA